MSEISDDRELYRECLAIVREQSEGEWTEENIRHGARTLEAFVRGQIEAVRGDVPADVRRLVIAARLVAFEDHPAKEALRELDAASEEFADRVPWDDEPEDALPISKDPTDG